MSARPKPPSRADPRSEGLSSPASLTNGAIRTYTSSRRDHRDIQRAKWLVHHRTEGWLISYSARLTRLRAQREAPRAGVRGRCGCRDTRPRGRSATQAKEQACGMVAKCWDQTAWVRINAVGTDLAAADLEAVAGPRCGHPHPQGRVGPRRMWVCDRAPKTPLICAIETARGILAAQEIPAVPGVRHLSLGASTCGATSAPATATANHVRPFAPGGGLSRRPPRSIPSTACARASTTRGLGAQAESRGRWAPSGKSAIHPPTLGSPRGLHPSDEELEWAQGALDAFQSAEGNQAPRSRNS
jgi:citrate lyase subunit beta / citryl-CoA lyase